ncbi:MAG: azurin [Gammaproteobacteria bacterium]|nr:azurin [Gammaproteobacteria bacterium]
MKTRIFNPTFASFVLLLLGMPSALAQDCTIEMNVNDSIMFPETELSISKSECSEVGINLNHGGSLPKMGGGHNWILTLSQDADATAQDGMMALIENQFIKPGDERVIAATDLIGGGESTSVTFSTENLEIDAVYTYFCSFPGHSYTMRGSLTITE